MGIKPSYIKNLGNELIAKHGEKLSSDFEENKMVVAEIAMIDSKRVRNRVAGYISRKINRRRR
ncbi:ssu ribosomal protein s17e [hydrocarbon metagenome]|uniref:Ssu ribosomal protein s17e n=1 Tax=hydrocarbon metagenome TaxID=938273 RepID=A0A0W8FK54_9ZZZZ|nr:30S ribosomal protein S17e [Methanomicrobiaceae archaeon]